MRCGLIDNLLSFQLVLLCFVALAMAVARPARCDWRYFRTTPAGHIKARGTLTVKISGGVPRVSVRQFCFALGCRVFYQWASHRAIIENPKHHPGAIVSSITHLALVGGKVVRYRHQILSDAREGYLLPVGLATKIALMLELGKIYKADKPHSKPRPKSKHVSRSIFALHTIVIDPGHGGIDYGTRYGSIYEKDLALIYAMKLRDVLHQQMPKLRVLLTRHTDRYVSLPDRAKFANDHNANLFLSIHANHAADTEAQGEETYFLSPEATDDEARRLALLENSSWMKISKIKTPKDMVSNILVDMEQTRYVQHSALFASMIQQEIRKLGPVDGLKSRGVKQANFYVLSQVAMPSTLVEMGFLSNAGDRGRLMNVAFRDEFVKALVKAIKRYRDAMASPRHL